MHKFVDFKTRRGVRSAAVIALLALLPLGLAGCGPDEETVAEAARVEEWTAIGDLKAELQQKRAELAEVRERMAAAAAETAEEATEAVEEGAEAAGETLEAQFNNLDFQVQEATAAFGERLVNFINDDPMEQGAEPTERQLAALRLKAGEDLIFADEYGERGGDWARAIAIAEEAERLDPTNPEVQTRLAHYREMRYMSEERFGGAEKGMSVDEVKAALGVPARGNDREIPEQNRRAFYYMKGEDRSAAGVYFQKKNGEWEVYQTDFNALDGNTEG